MPNVSDASVLIALSTVPEATYGVPLPESAAPKNYFQLEKRDRNIFDYTPGVGDNTGSSTGTILPTRRFKTGDSTSLPSSSSDCSFQFLFFLLYAALGNNTPTALTAPAFSHVMNGFSLASCGSVGQLPSYTGVAKACEISVQNDLLWDKIYPGMTLRSLEITFEKNNVQNLLTVSYEFLGSGKVITRKISAPAQATPNFYTNVKSESELAYEFMANALGNIKLYNAAAFGGGAPYEPACDLRTASIRIENQFDETQGYGCGGFQIATNKKSGAVRGSLPFISQTVTGNLSMSIPKQSQFDAFDKVLQQSELSLKLEAEGDQIATSGSNYFVGFDLSKIVLDNAQLTADGGFLVINSPFTVLGQGNSVPFSVTTRNNIASAVTP